MKNCVKEEAVDLDGDEVEAKEGPSQNKAEYFHLIGSHMYHA